MLTCSNCGATIREGAKFCTTCGTRLNDVSSTNSTSVWQQVPAADSPESPTTAAPVDTTAQATEETIEPPTSETASTVGSTTTTGEDRSAFTWSWGSPVTADTAATGDSEEDGEPAPETTEIDEEAGIAEEESTAASTDASGDTVADATELSVLEDEPDTSDSSVVDSQVDASEDQPAEPAEVDDALLAVAEEESGEEPSGDEGKDSETLAAWAGNWDADDDDSDAGSTTGDSTAAAEPTTSGAVTGASSTEQAAASATATSAEDEHDDDKEDTVTKAERLIGELKALIPAMVRPSPSIPASRANTTSLTVASDLENAARVGQFDDVRDVLLAARDNPRDVDNVLKLSANVDRLLELLDDRNNLAKTAENAATRLRSGNKQSGIN